MISIIAGFLLVSSSFAQLNPIQNLDLDHWYIYPNNYFILSWEEPDPSEDTLMGYNVYRENDLYCFTSELSLYHTPGASNCGEDFLIYGGGISFDIHVTAVYNSTLEESDYFETVHCDGFLIGINYNTQGAQVWICGRVSVVFSFARPYPRLRSQNNDFFLANSTCRLAGP